MTMKKPPKSPGAGERKKAERALLEAALAYGHALDCREEATPDVAAKRDEAQELVDGAGDRLLAAARAYFVASPPQRPAVGKGRRKKGE
jgi:hypothetical protein